MRHARRILVAALLLAVVGAGVLGGPAAARGPGTHTPTPTPTSGVVSDRGLASFAVAVVLIAGTLLYLWRRRRTTD